MIQRSILLCGFMGVGKTTVGHLLSKKLKCAFYDLDKLVIEKEGLSISEIFKKYGESHFRDLESEQLANLNLSKPSVIALGGGTLNTSKNLDLALRSGDLVYLEARRETIISRLGTALTMRPLLAGLSDSERSLKISSLIKEREDIYMRSPFRVATDELTPEATVEKILVELKRSYSAQKTT